MADFLSRTGSRALTRLSMQQNAKQQLLAEASALQPDYDAVTKAIMDRELYAADYAPIANEVNGIVTNYMNKYNADPFYAFSREGRRAARTLKQIVNDPSIKMLEDNAKLADDQYKKALEKDLGGDFVVRGDKVAAMKGGQRVWIDVDDIGGLDSAEGDGLLTVDTDHQLTRNVFGVRGEIPSYNMTSVKNVDDKIRAAFSNVGTTEVARLLRDTGAGTDTSITTKNNINQLRTIANNLINSELTQDEKNTLMSKYLQSAGTPTKDGFRQWLENRIFKVAEGRATTVDERKDEVSITSKLAKQSAETAAAIGKETGLSPAHGVITGLYGTRPVVRSENGVAATTRANLLPAQETFSRSRGKYTDENGVTYTSRKLNDLQVFSDATDLGNVLLRVAGGKNQGQFVTLPNVQDFGVVADDVNGAPSLIYEYSYTGKDGSKQIIPSSVVEQINTKIRNGQPIPQELREYMTNVSAEEAINMISQADYRDERMRQAALADAQRQVQQKGYVSVLMNEPYIAAKVLTLNERGFFGIDQNSELVNPMTNVIKESGYQGKQDKSLREYYTRYAGQGDIIDTNAWYNPASDEVYELDVRIPLKSFQALHATYGGQVKGEREDVNIGTMGLFPKFDVVPSNILDPTSLPNMVGSRQFQTLDAFKNGR